jgi:hypothetical protein
VKGGAVLAGELAVGLDENKTVKRVIAAGKKLDPRMNFDF